MSANLRYKYCLVPMCKNTTRTTPNKLFLAFPKGTETREIWCQAMKRNPMQHRAISVKSHLHCCEDHFDLEEDVDNYMRVKLMGGKLCLKSGVVPHKFACQKRKTVPQPPTSPYPQISETPVDSLSPAIFNSNTYFTRILGCGDESVNVGTQTCSLGKINKAVQVKIKCRVRSKATSTQHTDVSHPPLDFDNANWMMRGKKRTPPAGVCVLCCGPLEIQRTSKTKLPSKATKNMSPKQIEHVFINEGPIDGMKQENAEDSFYLEFTDNIKQEPEEIDETSSEHHSTPNSTISPVQTSVTVQITNGQSSFKESELSNKKEIHIENECDIFARVIGTQLKEMPIKEALELQLTLQKTITDFRMGRY